MKHFILPISAALACAACNTLPAAEASEAASLQAAPVQRSARPIESNLMPRVSLAAAAAKLQLERIAALDDAGPQLNAVIALNSDAAAQAQAAERAGVPLSGLTVLIKDNIETRELPTTAGSLALKDNLTGRDAPLVANLRAAGGTVLGKTNLSEWANIRDDDSTSGWSAVGGLTRNPHNPARNTCGSSSGSGAAVAAGFAWAAIGTETNGSISCPASINGIVGFKPSVGLVSRRHVVPISSTQDTAGPMAKDVMRAARLLGAIAGEDAADPVTMTVPNRRADYTEGLSGYSLRGVRIGVMRKQIGGNDGVRGEFTNALADLERAGAILVDIDFEPQREMYSDSFTVLLFELREEMGKYLRSLPGEDMPRSLADLIRFNQQNAASEMQYFGQGLFELAESTTDREEYERARENAVRIAGAETLDRLLDDYDVKFLIAPTRGPAWVSDLGNGDTYDGSIGFGSPAAIAGYPHLTVPMGQVDGLPVGISFFGAKWSDHDVLKAGAAYERARTSQIPVPDLGAWMPGER